MGIDYLLQDCRCGNTEPSQKIDLATGKCVSFYLFLFIIIYLYFKGSLAQNVDCFVAIYLIFPHFIFL